MNSGENKTGSKDAFTPSLLSSYLVDASGINEKDDELEAIEGLAAQGKGIIKHALTEFRQQGNVKTIFQDFGMFVEMLRRRDKLTREELAVKSDIEFAEIVQIETNPDYDVSPRTLFHLERSFQLQENTLSKLSGAVTSLEGDVQTNIVRYAAKAKHANHLNDEEQQILNEVIALLSEKG
ncbi:hypothetical protein PDESU_02236 [Pontiella desulfatans]|uniref:HTH cro/C1-type domain-containing protein n=1 Tax=Pontiella desulfatans TaxID=2750659 RepID=A0A6C2U1J1_PONDE|nr:hypothetical protein [Pontiella desulfatans]VGO13679.1 hypothetical protein PDESU_02236 [Pontiella desulfatans]